MEDKEKIHPEVLFLFPSFEEEGFLDFILIYHLGTGYILAYLKDKGIYGTQFIYKEPIDLYTLTKRILETRSNIVGFTCYDTNYYFIKLISQALKRKNPNLIIMVGGPTATFSDTLIMQDNPAIDICVRGEGEYTVYELVRQLRTNPDISNIKGITYRQNGQIVQTQERPLIKADKKDEELDILPSPYLKNIFPSNENFGILTSRGCVFKCIYCNYSAMSRWTVRYHSIERVISELKIIHRQFQSKNEGLENGFVEIQDDTFSLNIERAKRICRRIIEEKLHLSLWAETRTDRVDKELLYLMQAAGFRKIHFGLESSCPNVLNSINKVRMYRTNKSGLIKEKIYIRKARENIKLAKEIGIDPTVSIVLGLPGSTFKDDKKTLEFIRQLKVKSYYHDYLRIFSGTELFKTYKKYGLDIKQPLTVLPYQTKFAYDVYKIPEMENALQHFTKRKQVERIMRLITGDYRNLSGDGYPDLLLNSGSLIDKKTLRWLKYTMAISPVISFMNHYSEDDFLRQDVEKMIRSGLPVINFYLLSPLSHKDVTPIDSSFVSAKFELSLATEILTNRKKDLSTLDLLEFVPFASDIKKKDIGKIIFTLYKLDDIKKFMEFTSHYSNEIVLKGDMAKFDCYFLDECRWSNKDCPAVRFRRAIVEKDGSILPCFNGQPIAKVGDERKDIIKNLRLLCNDMREKRGCDDCPVKGRCSKCLFPFPLSSGEYCNIRSKLSPHLNKSLCLLDLVRRIKLSDHDLYLMSDFKRIQGIFDQELVVVNIGRNRYMYEHNLDRLYKKEGI